MVAGVEVVADGAQVLQVMSSAEGEAVVEEEETAAEAAEETAEAVVAAAEGLSLWIERETWCVGELLDGHVVQATANQTGPLEAHRLGPRTRLM